MVSDTKAGATPSQIEADVDPPMINGPRSAQPCTSQQHRFLRRHVLIFELFFFGLGLATKADEMRNIAAKALAFRGDEEALIGLREVEQNPNPTLMKLNSFAALQSENIVIRVVDNFLSYLSEIIQVAIKKQPKILSADEAVKLEDVLRFSRYSDLVSYLIEKKINELSYQSIREIENLCRHALASQCLKRMKSERCLC